MRTAEQRFWSKVDKKGPEDCWEWTASKYSGGYGQFRPGDGKNCVNAHRFSWELENGPIPSPTNRLSKTWVLHRCDSPGCVNPRHLWLGCSRDNVHDMVKKGRDRPGGIDPLTRKRQGVGRPPVQLSDLDPRFPEILERYEKRDLHGKRSLEVDDAADILEISRRTFWRQKKLYLASLP